MPIDRRPLLLHILAISRAYSIPYVALAGITAMLVAVPSLRPIALLAGLLIPLSLTIGLAALNDYLHRDADHRAGRDRPYDQRLLISLGAGGSSLALLGAFVAGPLVLAGVLGSIVCGLLYAKAKHLPGLGNLFRGLSGAGLIFGLAAINQAQGQAWPLIAGVLLLDAGVNIWGDVRDEVLDQRSNTRTLVLVAPRSARIAAVVLQMLAIGLLSRLLPAAATTGYSLLLVLPLLSWLVQPGFSHLIGLIGKYCCVGLVGIALAGTALELATVLVLLCSVLPSALVYWQIHVAGMKLRNQAAQRLSIPSREHE
jgi:hypothetical protein